MAYRFAGEVVDVEALLARGRRAGTRKSSDPEGMVKEEESKGPARPGAPGKPAGVKVKPETENITGIAETA
jgi:hypothetical protein